MKTVISLGALGFAALANATLIVDRGLPNANLNDAAGANRSNVSWSEGTNTAFTGDDFVLPSAAPQYTINSLRLWIVGDTANNNSNLTDDVFLGNIYRSISLYMGNASSSTVNRVALANFVGTGSDATTNANVVTTRVQYANGTDYESFGSFFTLVRVDFNNLNLTFNGGTTVQFGAQVDDPTYNLGNFNHASNAVLSGTPQQGSDNRVRIFNGGTGPTATFDSFFDSGITGWDKSSDINVQVFATPVPEPASIVALALGLAAVSRKRAKKS